MSIGLEEDSHFNTETVLKDVQLDITLSKVLVSMIKLVIVGSDGVDVVDEVMREVNTCEKAG